jgi:hypothetical protein
MARLSRAAIEKLEQSGRIPPVSNPGSGSRLEQKFENIWRHFPGAKIPLLRELQFYPGRKWRFDFAHPAARVAIEIDGGTFGIAGGKRCRVCRQAPLGRHSRGSGRTKDLEKALAALEEGWIVVALTPPMVHTGTVERIRRLIEVRMP